MRRSTWAILATLAALGPGCNGSTRDEFALVVHTDVAATSFNRLVVAAGTPDDILGPRADQEIDDVSIDGTTSGTRPPWTISIVSSTEQELAFLASGQAGETTVVESMRQATFERGQGRQAICIQLHAACIGVECPSGESCQLGTCVNAASITMTLQASDPVARCCETFLESCNQRDDDCDGAVDESASETCAMLPNAEATSSCGDDGCMLVCKEHYADCDNVSGNGCETDTRVTLDHCGACNQPCVAPEGAYAASCESGACIFACSVGYHDCDGDLQMAGGNGCESDVAEVAHCGACGRSCEPGYTYCELGYCDGIDGEAPADLSAGADHSCAVSGDGQVLCWGANEHGQLGSGLMPSSIPVRVDGLDAKSKVAIGDGFSCALGGVSEVQCWGDNSLGQAGIGTSGGAPLTPSHAANFPPMTALDTIVAGGSHACAADSVAGKLYCWGNNSAGQIGVGTMQPYYHAPQEVTLGAGVIVDLTAGQNHTCVIIEAGTYRVYCWGASDQSQLGPPSAIPEGSPAEVVGAEGMIDIEAGDNFTCGRRATGQIQCWGSNSRNQLGSSHPEEEHSPNLRDIGFSASFLTAGGEHDCGWDVSDGYLKCWGSNTSGQLGNGSSFDSGNPVVVSGFNQTTAEVDLVVAGRQHTCVRLLLDHALFCWGDNGGGRLGDGTTNSSSTARPVRGFPVTTE